MITIGGCGISRTLVDEQHTVFASQPEIGQNKVDDVCFEDVESALNVGGDIDFEIVFEGSAQTLPGMLFIIDNEESWLHLAQ
jgi:hypothetical protein